MDEEIYSIALRNALTEIKNAYTDIAWSFLLTKNGTVITSQENAANPNIVKPPVLFRVWLKRQMLLGA